ncbi:MAG: hypothetical protein ACLS63_02960 [Flavonifractor plautii]
MTPRWCWALATQVEARRAGGITACSHAPPVQRQAMPEVLIADMKQELPPTTAPPQRAPQGRAGYAMETGSRAFSSSTAGVAAWSPAAGGGAHVPRCSST